MTIKILQFTILLVLFACLTHACTNELEVCKTNDQCCRGYCMRFPKFTNGLCIRIRSRRDVIDEDGVQDPQVHDVSENDEDDEFAEEIEDYDSADIFLTTTPKSIGKHCAHAGTPCNPKSNSCCSKRCVQRRHETISRCAHRRRGYGRTSTANPTSTPIP